MRENAKLLSGRVPTYRCSQAVVFFTLMAMVSSVHAEIRFSPVAIHSYPPVDVPSIVDPPNFPRGRPPFAPPEGVERYREQKRAIAYDPSAQAPDTILHEAKLGPLILTSFSGLNQLSLPDNNLNPPDPTIGKSGFRVLQAVNSSLRLMRPDGTILQTKSLASFLGASATNGVVFDPRIIFDRLGPNLRFYVVAAQVDIASRYSSMYLAVSRDPNPSNLDSSSWCIYWIPSRRDIGTPNESFADYPMLGVGADTLVLSRNQARFSSPAFTFAVVDAFNKTTLSNNQQSCPIAVASVFQPSTTAGDLNIYSLQPVEHWTAPSSGSGWANPAYLVSTAAPPSSTYRIWAVRNTVSGPATLTAIDVSGNFSFNSPADAPQLGTTVLLDTNNWRIRQAVGHGDSIWAVHTTVCSIGPLPNESCARLVRFNVMPGSSLGSHQASLSAQTTFGGGENNFYWMPGIAVNANLQTALIFLNSNSSRYLSTLWSIKNNADLDFSASYALTSGNCPQTQGAAGSPQFSRTGDYMGAQTNPNDSVSFWLSGERAATLSGTCRWDTQVIHVTP